MIHRYIENKIFSSLRPGTVVALFGARRAGKTVLMQGIKEKVEDGKALFVNGEDLDAAEILSSQRLSLLKRFIADNTYLFIDEAQKIPKIGLNLKLIADSIPDVAVMVSGSSAFDLKNQIGEPLVGRGRNFHLYPIAQLELQNQQNFLQAKEELESRLIFGSYPQVIMANTVEEKKVQLNSIKDGYLLKDILEANNLKDSLFVLNLLRLIAFQIGNDISYSELASNLNADKKTVMRYLELLEKSFVIFSLPGFSRNLRKEYTRAPRYYFWDNGVRNAVISNYNFLNSRDDVGKLWENYCVAERIKMTSYKDIYANRYFWRTYDQKEIDYLEERDGKLFAYEIKWKDNKIKPPKEFLETYTGSTFEIINRENYLDFIT